MATASSLRNHRIVIASLFLPQTVILGSPDDYSPSREPLSSPSDNELEDNLNVSEVSSKLQDKARPKQTPLSPTLGPTTPKTPYLSGLNKPPLLKSIVDDLRDRATSALPSPTKENLNPFFVLSPAPISRNVSGDLLKIVGKSSSGGQSNKPSSGNKVVIGGVGTNDASPIPGSNNRSTSSSLGPPSASTTHIQRSLSRRMRKQGSRSSSRRPGVSSSKGGDGHQSLTGLLTEDEEYETTFYFEASPRCNGGLKNALDSVSREPPSSQSPRPVRPGHSRANSLQSLSKLKEKVSVGTLGVKTDGFTDGLKRNIDERLRKEHECEAVWVGDDEFEGCYDEFCHQVLWPALHYVVPDAPKTKMFYESASYKQYVAVNKAFAEKIAEVWQEGDVVWVNDYHLMLLPLMLRSSGLIPSNAPIGFFLHAAFPSSEIFRCLSVRAALLRGVLGANLVGFQTANHARHFRQTCSRILSVESLPRGIQLGSSSYNASSYPTPPPFTRSVSSSSTLTLSDSAMADHKIDSAAFASTSASMGEHGKGRFVDVGVFPMGIDVNQLNEKRKDPEVAEWVDILKQRYNGMKLVVGRDKMDGVQGVRQKIQAFERFLEFYASKDEALKEKVVLIQIAMPPGSGQADEGILSSILTTVSHINSRFSTLTYQPVVFLHTQEVSFSQYLALLRAADAFLVTSLREGMALRSHEFVVCQEGKEKEGSLILSEFTGSYSYSGFRSCIAINPWDIRGTAAAINQGLTMSAEESHSRWEDLQGHVMGQNAQAFVIGFLTRCLRAAQEGDTSEDDGDEENRVLNVKKLVGRWKHCKTRLVVVDYEDGLISSIVNSDSPPSAEDREKEKEKVENAAVEVLRALVKDSRNEVWLLSGFPRKELEKVSQEVGGRLGIVAENGCFIKPRNAKGQEGEWISMVASLNLTWKSICSEMLNYFTERTPGAYVEEREASVVWRFWSPQEVDDKRPDCLWARRQAAEAQNHIFDSLGERFGLRIIPFSNSFLVLPNNISWSTAVGSILLGLYGSGNEWDIVVALSGDERLLRRLGELDNSETVSTSGKGSTDAKWRLVRDIQRGEESDVVKVLREFTEC